MRVVISAGGTGGHIYPAISIINKIKEKEPNSKFLYIGTSDRMESEIIPKLGINYLGIEIKGLKKNIIKSLESLNLFRKAIKKCRNAISEFKPDIVLGIGGYVTAPVIYSAKKLGYKTIIHEQNSIPGKSNRFLSRYADIVMVSLPGSMKYFKHKNIKFTGNPRSEEAQKVKPINKKDLGLSPSKKLVMIVMGSLGSMTISRELLEIVPKFSDKKYEVLLVTGNNYYDKFKDIKIPSNVKIVPFLDNMLNILHKTDLIITRAGASTISEITSLAIPSILVPSPYVANNHQYYNAKELVDNNASILLEEKDFNSVKLLESIDFVLENSVLYKSMQENAKKLCKKDSSEEIYKLICNIIKRG